MGFKLSANVSAKPIRSHALLLVMALAGLICLVIAFFFLWHKLSNFWIPLVPGVALLAFVGIAWFWSQRDVDWANATPLSVTSRGGDVVTTDIRALTVKGALEKIVTLCTSLANRTPLPPPDGLIDMNGRPIPESAKDAISRVNEVNQLAKELTDRSIDYLTMHQTRAAQASSLQPRELPHELNLNRAGEIKKE
ncbi:MAG TPA: hypothetical protein VJP80_03770 [Candidatus Saccharimonadales bacterium]|nr:hypothetical protein [Candidatus Saccharimonadales bacterium]